MALGIDEHECGHRHNGIKCEESSKYTVFYAFFKRYFLHNSELMDVNFSLCKYLFHLILPEKRESGN